MDGFELAELMRGAERTRSVPIIFITAGEHDQRRVFKGYETGAVDFLYKPIDPVILRNKADVFFQLYRQKQQISAELVERTETLRLNEMFTAVLGHDLRSPLNAILTSAQLIELHARDPMAQEAAARIVSSGRRMARMIDGVLDLARARLAGGIPIRPVPTDLGQLVHRVISEHRSSFPEGRIELRHEGDLRGEWDADRLAQVASNLIGNAFQYGRTETPVRVSIDGQNADAVEFSVANEGAIPPDMLAHVFDPFRRGRQHATRNDGLGLGLYIVKQIVLAHRGSVDVQSAAEDETLFRVRMPRRASA
jgi:signal transduction histidine kinase